MSVAPRYQPVDDSKTPLVGGSSASASASGTSSSNFASDTGNLHERDILPELEATNIDDVIIESHILKSSPTSMEQSSAIFKEFNKHVKTSCFVSTVNPLRGTRLQPDEFSLAIMNNVPELGRCENGQKIATIITPNPNVVIEQLGVVKQMDVFYGRNGVYVLNVPRGKYAKVFLNSRPKLLAQGPHVIHDINFKFSPSSDFVDVQDMQIQHQSIHVLRIPVGMIAKTYLGPTPYLLYARADGRPYIIDNQLFRVEGFVSQTEQYISHSTIHILNIPPQKLAKIWLGTEPRILQHQPSPYEFHSPRFSIERASANDIFFDALSLYIRHGPRHLLRIPPGFVGKVWRNGTQADLLYGKESVYDITDPQFRVAEKENSSIVVQSSSAYSYSAAQSKNKATKSIASASSESKYDENVPYPEYPWLVLINTAYIRHGNIHVIRVPQGKLLKILENGDPKILYHQTDPYRFDSPTFEIVGRTQDDIFFDLNTPYIGHGAVHVVRVASGKVAKVSTQGSAKLLESRLEPYVFNDLYFTLIPRVDKNSSDPNDVFFDATDKLIVHGALKRVIPRTGEVAVTYQNGKLVIVRPGEKNEPTVINDESAVVSSFLFCGVQTLVFPSDNTKEQRLKENRNVSPEEINYEIFTTKDSLKVGVKLLVAYIISDPQLVIEKLRDEQGIIDHIEHCSTADMGKAIQQCSSQEFLTSYQNKPTRLTEQKGGNSDGPSAPVMQHFQDIVKDNLSHDLAEYGIELVRLNFETPRVLDTKIAEEMGKQSLISAQVSAKEAVLNQQFNIARTEAQQKAEVARISQEIENNNKFTAAQAEANTKINAAKAELEAARLKAEAMVTLAEAQKKVTILEAEAKQEALEKTGAQFAKYPALFYIELAKIKTQYFKDAQVKMTVTPQELLSFVQSQQLDIPTIFTDSNTSLGLDGLNIGGGGKSSSSSSSSKSK